MLPPGLGDALGQGGGHAPQLEPFEQRCEIVCAGYGGLLMPYGNGICQNG